MHISSSTPVGIAFPAILMMFLFLPVQAHAIRGVQLSNEAVAAASGIQAELLQNVERLEERFIGLAETMIEHYEWRPEEGVRSVSEVLMHIANSNHMFASMLGAEYPEELQGEDMQATFGLMQEREQITDPGEVRNALSQSFAQVKDVISGVSDEELESTVTLFGQDATQRRVMIVLVTHMHEHLGQAIAYARTNGVTPPWSN